MRTTKRPAWTITPGTRTLIDGKEREITYREESTDIALMWGPGPWQNRVILNRLAPVVIVLDHQEAAA